LLPGLLKCNLQQEEPTVLPVVASTLYGYKFLMVKPLDFSTVDTPKQEEKKSSGPKPLSFDNQPIIKQEKKEEVKSFAIQFDDSTPISTPTKKNAQPKSLFAQANSPLLELSLQKIEQMTIDQNLKDKLTRQVRQLVDLDVDQIMKWGAPAVEDSVDGTKMVTQLTRTTASLNVTETLEEVNKAVDGKTTIKELFSSKNISIKSMIDRLNDLEKKLKGVIDTKHIEKNLLESNERLNCFITALKITEESAKTLGNYDSIEDIMYNRRVLLTQASQQNELSRLQYTQTMDMIRNHLLKIEQLVMITIPAFEAAQASRGK